ncbi:hypothetical protein BC936DRAFT_149652 [Jimgerdemannia flammicorona]|uniref:Uncharacterized protein n=1 Tax=Jimgerdemannia flammicorona TaxID=994334 RepID=A0A433D0E7_9FUNG|nr:hypothetical protein BC936DRAFT_149652 [Jimgerdemannia flammicorona]
MQKDRKKATRVSLPLVIGPEFKIVILNCLRILELYTFTVLYIANSMASQSDLEGMYIRTSSDGLGIRGGVA